MPTETPWVEQVQGVTLLPVLHGRVEFSRAIRDALRELCPAVLAVELPRGLESIFQDGVSRFPYLSYLTSDDLEEESREGEGAPLWRIEPSDPFCEGIRTARELGISVNFIDLYLKGYPAHLDLLPDPYSITAIGVKAYYEACREVLPRSVHPQESNHPDHLREQVMAGRLLELSKQGSVVALIGLKHIAPVAELLRGGGAGTPLQGASAGQRLPRLKLYHPSTRTVRTLAGEMPFITTLYELQRGGPGPDKAWYSPKPEPTAEPEKPADKPEVDLDKALVFKSLERLLGLKVKPQSLEMSSEQLKRLNAYLTSLRPETWNPLNPPAYPGSESQKPEQPYPDEREPRFFTFKSTEQRREELLEEYRRINEVARVPSTLELDRQLVYKELFLLAARYYQENTGEEVKRWQHDNFNRFSRRYAHLSGQLLPGRLPLILASRACVDHNFAYEFWDLATFYPWQESPQDDAPVFDFDGDQLSIDGVQLRHFEFHRTFPRLRQSLQRVHVPERHTPTDDPQDWAGAFESGRICSYPPEDIVIEDYGRYLQKKAIKVQSEAQSRTEPFTTSLLDGIDMRTTLRNWADGQKLYVREEKKVFGGTGSVVVVFDEDIENSKYPWCITWHGEHDQESDMAFYATDRQRKIIGPGIARCEYGGLMLSYPPRRLGNVWSDPYYSAAKTKAEVLLFSAIDYCQDKHIVYVAASSPRSYFFRMAQRLGKKLVYLPIGTLSPTSLERIRVFHVLAGHRYREIAKDFIW